jgi:hypothetical protein
MTFMLFDGPCQSTFRAWVCVWHYKTELEESQVAENKNYRNNFPAGERASRLRDALRYAELAGPKGEEPAQRKKRVCARAEDTAKVLLGNSGCSRG